MTGQQPPKQESLQQEISTFINEIDGLAKSLPVATLAVEKAHLASLREFTEFLSAECNLVTTESGKTNYVVEGGKLSRLKIFESQNNKTALARDLLPRSFFVSLVSQYDAFLGRLIRQFFRIKPAALNASENVVTYSQLTGFGSLDAARDFIIDREIDTVLRKSHSEQFDWLENKFGLSTLRKDLNAWCTFIEATERRNLFVHTSGRVSHQYLDICKKHSAPIPKDVVLGSTLKVNLEYFNLAHECIFEIGIKLAQVLWRKIDPSSINDADRSLIDVCFQLLAEGRYKLAAVLLDFGTETLPRHFSEENRLTLVINRAQAYKWAGDTAKSTAILAGEDWSAASPKFRLCRHVLLDEFDTACKLMTAITAQEIDKHCYRDWPIFKEIRKSTQFGVAFEQIFAEPLQKVVLASTNPVVN